MAEGLSDELPLSLLVQIHDDIDKIDVLKEISFTNDGQGVLQSHSAKGNYEFSLLFSDEKLNVKIYIPFPALFIASVPHFPERSSYCRAEGEVESLHLSIRQMNRLIKKARSVC